MIAIIQFSQFIFQNVSFKIIAIAMGAAIFVMKLMVFKTSIQKTSFWGVPYHSDVTAEVPPFPNTNTKFLDLDLIF